MSLNSPSKVKLFSSGSDLCKRKLNISVAIGAVTLLLLGVLYFALRLWKNPDESGGSYFTVVVDCGSTGTRVSVYEWFSRDVKPGELPLLRNSYPENLVRRQFLKDSCQYHCLQTKPGLDKFIGNASGIRAALEPLINWAQQWVPVVNHKETPIFVLATAGLRGLGTEEARRVLDDVEAVLKDYEFIQRKSWIRVLSGREESYYGWVALNYKMGRLGNSSKLHTLGLLDLGGSSLQVAMEDGDVFNDNQLARSEAGFIKHQDQVLSYSLQAYGLNAAFDRSVNTLSQGLPVSGISDGHQLKHPCLSSNFAQNYTCYDCMKLNVTDQKNFMQKVEAISVYMVGEPNWEECTRLARVVATNLRISVKSFPADSPDWRVDLSSQTGNDTLTPLATALQNASFHALSGFFAIHSKLGLSAQANSTEILEKGHKLCSRLWTNSSYYSENGNFGHQFCFQGPYMASLIDDAFRLHNKMITFGPADISWTLGAALVEGEFIWLSSAKTKALYIRTWKFLSSSILLFVLLLGLGLFVYHSQMKLPMPGKKRGAAGVSLPSYVYPKRQPN